MLRNRVRAFTLFETVITLAIVTAILSIGWLNFSVIKEKMLIDSASMQVKVILNQALRRASITNKLYLIDYYESDNLLIVKDQDGKVEKYETVK
ncbi:type II secretion system GspH family protein [Lactobacillus mulieris]|uniref:pilus assembly FimT family protein n=1 Tax=Lactobacillus mulieris TaxID=2508708 RepID=UPI001F3BFF8E|nr:type II secretion system protein [Lactobacillus mulieris]MCF1797941.1 type II secretion system GspH family protein [Lactobacillus mulieris]